MDQAAQRAYKHLALKKLVYEALTPTDPQNRPPWTGFEGVARDLNAKGVLNEGKTWNYRSVRHFFRRGEIDVNDFYSRQAHSSVDDVYDESAQPFSDEERELKRQEKERQQRERVAQELAITKQVMSHLDHLLTNYRTHYGRQAEVQWHAIAECFNAWQTPHPTRGTGLWTVQMVKTFCVQNGQTLKKMNRRLVDQAICRVNTAASSSATPAKRALTATERGHTFTPLGELQRREED